MSVRRSVLPSGLRIVTEEVPSVRSAAVGIWVNVGSRDEAPATAGASHFLEHLLFKGTPRRTALEISSAIESVGGEMNAFTTKEYTCFYARVIDSDLPLAIDVIADLITSSIIASDDVDAERKVVLEEIAMRDDDPSDLVHDLFSETFFGDTPIGRPILGSIESITTMSRDTVFNYYKKGYRPEDLVVAISGNFKHRKVVDLVEQALTRDNFLHQSAIPVIRGNERPRMRKPQPVGLISRKTEQAHMFYGMEGVARADERRFAMGVMSAALGGGMSSRLFQEIREKRGLAYSVYSYAQQFAGTGVIGFYAGCNPSKAVEVTTLIRDIVHEVCEHGMSLDEIERAKGAVRGALVLSQEDTGSRMSRIGKSEIVYGEILSFDDILKAIDRVTPEDIREIAREFLVKTPTLALVGPFKSESKFEKIVAGGAK